MTEVCVSDEAAEKAQPAGAPDALDGPLINQLVDGAKADGVTPTGRGRLLQQRTKKLLSALEGEITYHLGHDKAADGNARNGTRSRR
ncbi:hypothetical protein [Streptomyces sp. NPDC014733]|uniref:hypothetical protein n=1 Tax=Streptomyces sp. NPDC014733 TaxID=3364885 RepID=UPI0036FE3419